MLNIMEINKMISNKFWDISGGFRNSQGGGFQPIICLFFAKKLQENEKINLTEGGGGIP